MKSKDPRDRRAGEKQPFFARFLEEKDLSRVAGGRPPPNETHKEPSDNDG